MSSKVEVVTTVFPGIMLGIEYGLEDDAILVDLFFFRIIFFLSGY